MDLDKAIGLDKPDPPERSSDWPFAVALCFLIACITFLVALAIVRFS